MRKFDTLFTNIINEFNEQNDFNDTFLQQLKIDFGKALEQSGGICHLSSHDNIGPTSYGVDDGVKFYTLWVENRGMFADKVVELMKEKYPSIKRIDDFVTETQYTVEKPLNPAIMNSAEKLD